MSPKPTHEEPENPAPEPSPEQAQAALEASLSIMPKATTGGTGTIKVTG
ncbi:MAG: hypothetical protein HXX12_01815 [Geothrix sp.]|nr:hypothetical protein [Geothrix sp.]NWJ39690.1 hypothetical protein [Geothrix sp.]WIL22291.1 MAG: hypothetical protein QOZ81_001588 [Geothrix sp.]